MIFNLIDAAYYSFTKAHVHLYVVAYIQDFRYFFDSAKDIFDMEYWVLEQMKLKKKGENLQFRGKIALVTGAANGIGRATAEVFLREGAVVVGLDIHKKVGKMFSKSSFLGIVCDVTDKQEVKKAVQSLIKQFGGLDILVSNAGIFPESESISELKDSTWNKSLDVNLSSHQHLLQTCIPYLSYGLEASVVFIASKNVSAPGPGVAAYSVAKAGLTQLGRIAALELAEKGIRVNVVHPNAVFDTGIWTKDVLKKRAKHYKMSVKEYKTNNLLKTEVTSKDVAKMVCLISSSAFSKTTGAQIPIDGGNERVI
ncbi:SDR family oxidoreductase [PVC group bacterium]|nr:SDR family oxidoreductase [PVC group bacterium]